jgi:hypothetical protein
VKPRIDVVRADRGAADGPAGPRESARQRPTTAGRPAICDEHDPPPPGRPARSSGAQGHAAPREFLALGGSGEAPLISRAAGAQRVQRKMAEATISPKLHVYREIEARTTEARARRG